MTAVPETDEFDSGEAVAHVAQPRQLIVPVYGLYSRREGGWLSVATLIGLLADPGVDESAVRSSISRLKRRGILEAIRRDGTAGYELSDQALAILREVTTGSSSASARPGPTAGCSPCSRCPKPNATSDTSCGPS